MFAVNVLAGERGFPYSNIHSPANKEQTTRKATGRVSRCHRADVSSTFFTAGKFRDVVGLTSLETGTVVLESERTTVTVDRVSGL